MIQEPNITNKLSLENLSVSLDKADIMRLVGILQERLTAASELEINNFKKQNQTDDEFEKNKDILRDGYKIRPTITGTNGAELFGLAETVFNSPNFPKAVKSIYINSSVPLKATHGYIVRNHLEILLDFSRPGIFDFNFMPSGSTPNSSNIKVEGADPTWVHGVFGEIQQFISEHKPNAQWLHRHTIYDILLLLIGYPIGFWMCFKATPYLSKVGSIGPFLRAAIYVYLFFAVLIGFRALFHYSRWVFPVVEYKHANSKSAQHQVTLWALLTSLIGSFIYDVIRSF